MRSVIPLSHFACPECGVLIGAACRNASGVDRLPHLRRVLLWAAGVLVTIACGRHHRASWTLPDVVAVTQAIEDDRQDEDHRMVDIGRANDDELVLSVSMMELQQLITAAARTNGGRSLDLSDVAAQAEGLGSELRKAHRMTSLLRNGLQRPSDADSSSPTRPTPEQAQIWQELHGNQELRDRAVSRDQTVGTHQRQAAGRPAAWRIGEYLPNGYFLAHRAETDARTDGEHGLIQVHGWAAVPEAVPDILRSWSTPAARPITVTWAVEAPAARSWSRRPNGSRLRSRSRPIWATWCTADAATVIRRGISVSP